MMSKVDIEGMSRRNATLLDRTASTADSLEREATALVEAMALFRLGQHEGNEQSP
jgi:hypothetical protein